MVQGILFHTLPEATPETIGSNTYAPPDNAYLIFENRIIGCLID